MRGFLACIAAALFIVACSAPLETPPGEADGVRQALVELVGEKDEGERIRLSDAWPGAWDRAAVLRPYSDDAAARDVLGFDFAYEAASPWINTEGGVVVVLANGAEAMAWFKIPSDDVGLHCVPELVVRDFG